MVLRNQTYGKQVSLKASNIDIINGFMNKTKTTFSGTLNIIVEQWDKFSIIIMQYEKNKETKKELNKLDEMKEAKVIKQ